MGLSASQARLLFLTARKSDIEFNEMKVANAKIALSRDTEKVSEAYANALNAKKITWAVDGTTTSDQTVDLTYNLLMRPNNLETGHQFIYTSATTNRVVLDNQYAAILGKSSGNAGEAGSLSKFVAACMGIDESTLAGYIDDGNKPTNPTSAYSDSTLLSESGLQDTYSGRNIVIATACPQASFNNGDGTSHNSTGAIANQITNYKISSTAMNYISTNFGTVLDSIAGKLGTALQSELSASLGSGFSSQIQQALTDARTKTYAKFVYNSTDGGSGSTPTIISKMWPGGYSSGCEWNCPSLAEGSNQLVDCTRQKGHTFGSGNVYGFISVDGAQVIDTFLDYFDQAMATALPNKFQSDPSNVVGATSTTRNKGASSLSITPDPKNLDGDRLNNNGISDAYEISFYTNLFNAINGFGWCSNDNVQDKSYLQGQLMNGNIAIKELQSDGSWKVLSDSDPNSPMRIETDDDAITAAEAKYQSDSAKLNTKEKKLDLELKNLDTERSALDTEIDSVKSVISKNVERSFKMFQA